MHSAALATDIGFCAVINNTSSARYGSIGELATKFTPRSFNMGSKINEYLSSNSALNA